MTTEKASAQTELEKIKDRIAKLLRMAKDSASPNEAAIAAARARSLMDKYQLSEHELSGHGVKDVFAQSRATRSFKDIPTYMSTLAVSVAKYNDCQAIYDYEMDGWGGRSDKKFVVFKGYSNDVELAVAMYDRLLKIMSKLAGEYLAAKMADVDTNDPTAIRAAVLFKNGCTETLNARLAAMTVERDQIANTAGTSLVLVKSNAVAEHFGKVSYSSARSVRAVSDGESSAMTAGRIKGHMVEITKAVGV